MKPWTAPAISTSSEILALRLEGPVFVTGLPGSGKSWLRAQMARNVTIDLDSLAAASGEDWIVDIDKLEAAVKRSPDPVLFGTCTNFGQVVRFVVDRDPSRSTSLIVVLPSQALLAKSNFLKSRQLSSDAPKSWRQEFARRAQYTADDILTENAVIARNIVKHVPEIEDNVRLFYNKPPRVDNIVKGWH